MKCKKCGCTEFKEITADCYKCSNCGKYLVPEKLQNQDCTEYGYPDGGNK